MLNNITLNGRLTKDPDVRETKDGTLVADFSIACEQDFKNSQGEKAVDYFDCAVWRQGAEYIKQYGSQGDMVSVSGRMKTEHWQDKDGNKRKSYKVQVERIYVVARKLNSERQGENHGGHNQDPPPQSYGNNHGGYHQEPPQPNYGSGYNQGQGYQNGNHGGYSPGDSPFPEGDETNLPF